MSRAYRDEGIVYYVLDATRRGQFLKIGFTTKLVDRIAALRWIASSGQIPIVLALEEGGTQIERQRHAQFADLRSHGEWFRYENPLLSFVADMEHPFSYLLDRPHLWRWAGGWGPLGAAAYTQGTFEGYTYKDLAELTEGEREDEDIPAAPIDF